MYNPRRFVILDRDGTLIVERHYLRDPDGVELLPGVIEGLARLRRMGLGLIVVTNQAGIGRGYFGRETVEAIQARLEYLLGAAGIALDASYYCPHAPWDGCDCRKPAPGLVHRAEAEFGFDAKGCFVIGDNAGDIELGIGIGARTILVTTGYGRQVLQDGRVHPDFVVSSFANAADVVEQCLKESVTADAPF